MSLVGNLEDLGFGDILQIISLSRKSGVFLVQHGTRRAKILFRDGQVLSAFTNFERQDLCSNLLEAGHVDDRTASRGLQRFMEGGGQKGIAECLIAEGAPAGRVENAIRSEIERVVLGIFAWPDGEFSFELKEIEGDLRRITANPECMIHPSGINPQFLAMEGTRLGDEAQRESPAPPDPPAGLRADIPGPGEIPGPANPEPVSHPVVQGPAEPAAEHPASAGPVILVDDDALVLELVAGALEKWGYRVEGFEAVGVAATRVEELAAGEGVFCVVSDLILPRIDGEGILGGLELLERVRAGDRRLPFVLISDHPDEEAERRARLLDVDFTLAKPRVADVRDGSDSPALTEFLSLLGPVLSSFRDPDRRGGAAETSAGTDKGNEMDADSMVDLRSALLSEIDESSGGAAGGDFRKEEAGTSLSVLRSMVCELSNPLANGQISLLLLRFAAEVMNRAVLFMVNDKEVVGLGQFGIEIPGRNPDALVREIRIPLDQPSVFHDVARKLSVLRGPLEENPWNIDLLGRLGGGRPVDAFVAPVVAEGRVAVVIYGDNLPEKAPVRNTEALEIFLTQAGLAFEKAILERRIREISPGC